MGTTGCSFHVSTSQQGYGKYGLLQECLPNTLPWEQKDKLHSPPDRAIENIKLVYPCTEPTRLCECQHVQHCSPEHSRLRMLTRCYSKFTETRAHRTGQDHQGRPKRKLYRSSSPQVTDFPNPPLHCASTQPYAAIRPLVQGLSKKIMRPVDSHHKKFP